MRFIKDFIKYFAHVQVAETLLKVSAVGWSPGSDDGRPKEREVKKMSKEVKTLTKEQEEKRLEDFKRIAENWDKFPERVQGKIDGVISMAASAFLSESKKAG